MDVLHQRSSSNVSTPPASPAISLDEAAITSPEPSSEPGCARPVSRTEASPDPSRYVRRIAHARSSRKRAVPSATPRVSPVEASGESGGLPGGLGGGRDRGGRDEEETLEDFLVFASGEEAAAYDPPPPPPTFSPTPFCGPALFFIEDTTVDSPPAGGGCLSFGDDLRRPEPSRKRMTPTVDFDYDVVARKNASDAPAAFTDPSRVVYETFEELTETPPAELARCEAPPGGTGGAGQPDAAPNMNCALSFWLASRGLGAYLEPIQGLGLRKISDLALLSGEDLDEMGMPEDLRVNIRISIG